MEKIRERSAGVITGTVIADALGGPFKFMTAQEISERHGTIREMIGGGSYDWKCGEYTGNTLMMHCVVESLVAWQKYHLKDIAQKFVDCCGSNRKDIGCTTEEALDRLCRGVPVEHSGVDKPTNGTIMRCVPLSLVYYQDEEALVEASMEVSGITHHHLEAGLSSAFINVMIAQLLTGAGKKEAYVHAVGTIKKFDRNFVKKYLDSSRYKPESNKSLAVNTLLLAIGSFMAANSFEEAVAKAISFGGDANTTGAVAGSLAGAYFGKKGIPRRWSEKLNPLPAEYFAELGEMLFYINPS